MERRLPLFIFISFAIFYVYVLSRPQEKKPDAPEENPIENVEDKDNQNIAGNPDPKDPDNPEPIREPIERETQTRQFLSLGSVNPDTKQNRFRMLVCFDTKGAAIRSLELSDPQYMSLEHRLEGGYLGRLVLEDIEGQTGSKINVVGDGTPAALAVSSEIKTVGLKPGDLITKINDQVTENVEQTISAIKAIEPGQTISISVDRPATEDEEKKQSLTFQTTLTRHPLEVIKKESSYQENKETGEKTLIEHPSAFLTTLSALGNRELRFGEKELKGLESLLERNWKPIVISDEEIHFETSLTPTEIEEIGEKGHLKLIKKFKLLPVPEEELGNIGYAGYHLDYTLEIHNESAEPISVAYRQHGPSGLPLEGWWYSNKIGRSFSGAGVRDVVWESTEDSFSMFTVSSIVSRSEKEGVDPETPLYSANQEILTKYAGVDAIYFASALIFDHDASGKIPLDKATAQPVGPKDPVKVSKTDCSFSVDTLAYTLSGKDEAGAATDAHILRHHYRIFAGPKETELLATYDLGELEYYGWFSFVSKLLLVILHFLHDTCYLNYGIAIVVLTVIVRSAMIPLSRKQNRNMQLQQALAPELKKIREMYKDDMQKQHEEQQALFKKYNFNPVGGCGLLFVQLPIFLGLYRALAVDIKLRQAPLIPGVEWCSNLSAPDQLWYWTDYLPEFLGGYNGYLGPYLNILPLFTVVLFIVQQKMFTPPPTNEQEELQQSIMKFMMLFMGVLFFRVPSGLCIYFITSSLWGIIERKVLPKPKLDIQVDPIDKDSLAKERKPRPKTLKKKKK